MFISPIFFNISFLFLQGSIHPSQVACRPTISTAPPVPQRPVTLPIVSLDQLLQGSRAVVSSSPIPGRPLPKIPLKLEPISPVAIKQEPSCQEVPPAPKRSRTSKATSPISPRRLFAGSTPGEIRDPRLLKDSVFPVPMLGDGPKVIADPIPSCSSIPNNFNPGDFPAHLRYPSGCEPTLLEKIFASPIKDGDLDKYLQGVKSEPTE